MNAKLTAGLRLIAPALVVVTLAGCSGRPAQPAVDAGTIINPQRSARGNPAFYEVYGERYYVMASSDGYRENGIASWYGRDFHGKPTSSGEVYDMHQLTAAHKTLPIPTWVEVTNIENGRQVIVKVNDRGPFIDGRIIDLSQRAAEEIDMIRSGTARVRVRALGAPAAEPRPEPVMARTQPVPGAAGGGFSIISEARADTVAPGDVPYRPLYVQVGAFADKNNAAKLAERLKDEGFRDSFVLTSGTGRERMHRVRIGPIPNAGEFDRIRLDLRAVGLHDTRLVQEN